MATRYWNSTASSAVDLLLSSNWSATPANDDTLVIGKKSTAVNGGDQTTNYFKNIYVGPGFTGTLGTNSSRLKVSVDRLVLASSATSYLEIEDSSSSGTVELVLSEYGTIDIDDDRSSAASSVRIMPGNNGLGTVTIDLNTSYTYTSMHISGLVAETVNLGSTKVTELFVDGGTVYGGDVTTAHIADGAWYPKDCTNLYQYGGKVLPGNQGTFSLTQADIYGGEFTITEQTAYAVTLPADVRNFRMHGSSTIDFMTSADGATNTHCRVMGSGQVMPNRGKTITIAIAAASA